MERLRHETDITWTVPTVSLPRYVRETVSEFEHRRRGPIRWGNFRVVGWANLDPKARSSTPGIFCRRVFWLKDYDPYFDGGAPCEAVDPFTVSPGVPGRLTDRAVKVEASK